MGGNVQDNLTAVLGGRLVNRVSETPVQTAHLIVLTPVQVQYGYKGTSETTEKNTQVSKKAVKKPKHECLRKMLTKIGKNIHKNLNVTAEILIAGK